MRAAQRSFVGMSSSRYRRAIYTIRFALRNRPRTGTRSPPYPLFRGDGGRDGSRGLVKVDKTFDEVKAADYDAPSCCPAGRSILTCWGQ
jgi:hypothetical protein